jgi:hypothetical protein
MDPLAAEYTFAESGGPIIRCAGPVAVPSTLSKNVLPDVDKPQPVATVDPTVKDPLAPIINSVPELEDNVPEVWPVVSPKLKSLMSCATVLGFACRSESVIVRVSALVVNVAEASTGLPPVSVAPVDVEIVITLALALQTNRLMQHAISKKGLFFILCTVFWSSAPSENDPYQANA